MFAPMSPQTEYSRFEAETRDRERRAAHQFNAQPAPRPAWLARLVQRFSPRPPAQPAPRSQRTTSEHPVTTAC